MNDRVFLDTNIVVYFYSENEPDKRGIACQLLDKYDCVTSIQVFNEANNVWLKKYNLKKAQIIKYLDEIEDVCNAIMLIRRETIDAAIDLKDRYNYSYYDCLMLASALEANCNVILTEDMSNNQIINGKLKIMNPFDIIL